MGRRAVPVKSRASIEDGGVRPLLLDARSPYTPPVGSRSANETAVRIFQAFLRKGTWSQAALAREVGIQPPQLKRLLEGMERDSVLPLERDEEHPHVNWSVPEGWFPGGVFYQGTEVETLLRLLARSPKSKERDRLIAIANQCLDGRRDLGVMLTEVVRTTQPSASETANQVWVERSAVEKKPLHARYYSTRGNEGWRHISVQRVTPGPPVRFIGVCHRSKELRWFRVENVLEGSLDGKVTYLAAPAQKVEEMLGASLDGFFETGPTREHVFFVDDPDARWVGKNLLEGMRAEPVRGGLRVRISTAALPIVARFVAGLGSSAKAETEELKAAVVALAEGAIASNARPPARRLRRAR